MVHKPLSENMKNKLITAGAVLFWLAVWQWVSAAIGQEILLVSPVSVLLRLSELIVEKEFWTSVWFSLARISGGFLLAVVTGVLAAALAYRFSLVRYLLAPPVFAVMATPVASFIILCLVWVSSRNLSVLIAFLMTFPILYLNTLEGLQQTDPQLLEMAKVFRVPSRRKITGIYLPECRPYFLTGCRVSLGLCWKSGVAAEVIGLPDGSIGEMLYQAKIFLQTADLFAWTVTIIVISILFQKVFLWLVSRLTALPEGR